MAAVRRWLNQRTLVPVLFVLVFFGPMVTAWIVYANSDHWRPAGTTNRGELVVPARPLTEFSLQEVTGTPLGADYLHGKWTLVYIGDSQCPEACREAVYYMRQVRLALGADAHRVQRLLVLTDASRVAALQPFLQDYPGMAVASAEQPALERFLKPFEVSGGRAGGVAGRVYVVDPLGNLMMIYPPDAAPRGMLKDLQRLLKVSQIG